MQAKTPDFHTDLLTSNEIRVLLVDDQAMIAEGIRRMLADEENMVFHYCSDPSEAIRMATDIDATIILQDLVMPDIDGMTLVRFFRANDATKEIPIIVLSSKEDPVIKSEAFSHGANDYLVKLPDKIELIARIRSHSRHYLLQIERDAAFFALREMQKQLKKTNAELKRLSSLDGLTGIGNRRTFDETLQKEWSRAARTGEPISLLLLDIDYFKLFNDTYGHQGGDECLQKVAKALESVATRPGDVVARYGGEEFGLILPLTNADGARKLADHLITAVRKLGIHHGASKVSDIVTVSVGVCTMIPEEKGGVEECIEMADKALYQAKEQGRNRAIHCEDIAVES